MELNFRTRLSENVDMLLLEQESQCMIKEQSFAWVRIPI